MEMLTSALAPESKGGAGGRGDTRRLCRRMRKLSKDLEIWKHSGGGEQEFVSVLHIQSSECLLVCSKGLKVNIS